MRERIRFGPSGNARDFYEQGYTHTWQAPEWLAKMGLSALEYSFGRGVRLGAEAAGEIAQQAQRHDVQLSVHLPYYVNLATLEAEKRQKNELYFLESLVAARSMGAARAVFHPGSTAKQPRDQALKKACALLTHIIGALNAAGLGDIVLCPETMGKINQLGDLDEVIALCRVDERLLPCVDFGHLHCRGLGAIKDEADYAAILDTLERGVGVARAARMHIHFSRMEFTAGGEKMHHTFADTQYGPEYPPLIAQLAKRGYAPVVICESAGTQAADAKTMLLTHQNMVDIRETSNKSLVDAPNLC